VLDLVHEDGALVGFRLAHYSDAAQPMMEDVHIVRIDGGTARTETEAGSRHCAYITDDHLTVGQAEIEVLGPPAARVAIAQVFDGVILGRGKIDAEGKAVVVVTPLSAGHVLHAVNLDHPEAQGTYADVLYRWGESEVMPSGQRVARFGSFGLSASVGDSTFSVPLRLGDCEQAGDVRGKTYHAVLAVGTSDGITRMGQRVVLRPVATVRVDAHILDTGSGFARVSLPIPDQANLTGAVVAFQWWVFASPDDVRVSEVAATVLRSEPWFPPSNEAFFGLDRPARGFTSERPWNVWSRAALEQWLGEHSAADTSALVDRVFTLLRR